MGRRKLPETIVREMTTKRLLKLQVELDRAIRLERLKRMLATFAVQPELVLDVQVKQLKTKIEHEIRFIDLRKIEIDATLDHLEALLDVEE